MVHKQFKLTVALKDGVITNINDVESGLKCGCVCPACRESLVAKKGKKMMHHFAHHAGHSCEYGYESSLHLAAKEILSRAKRITLPAVYVSYPDLYKEDEMVCASEIIQIDKVELEQRFGDVIPDVVVYAGGKQYFVEIYVTHCIDEEKLAKLKKADISTIEIDLSKKTCITSVEELEALLLGDCKEKKWKYNSVSDHLLREFYKSSDKRTIIFSGNERLVYTCPKRSQVRRGQPCADYSHDCLSCEYYVATTRNNEIRCSGGKRIPTSNDLDSPESYQNRDCGNELDFRITSALETGTCPDCGDEILEKRNKGKTYWRCNNPHCKFSILDDPDTGEVLIKY